MFQVNGWLLMEKWGGRICLFNREEKGLLGEEAQRCEEGEWKKRREKWWVSAWGGTETGWSGAGSLETLNRGFGSKRWTAIYWWMETIIAASIAAFVYQESGVRIATCITLKIERRAPALVSFPRNWPAFSVVDVFSIISFLDLS